MSYLVGHYNCKLDAKGRVLVPSEFKEQLGDQVEEGFVLRPGLHAHCLELYTKQDWNEVQDQLRAKFSQFNKKQEAAMRRYDAGSRFVKLDASGRLRRPPTSTTSRSPEAGRTAASTRRTDAAFGTRRVATISARTSRASTVPGTPGRSRCRLLGTGGASCSHSTRSPRPCSCMSTARRRARPSSRAAK